MISKELAVKVEQAFIELNIALKAEGHVLLAIQFGSPQSSEAKGMLLGAQSGDISIYGDPTSGEIIAPAPGAIFTVHDWRNHKEEAEAYDKFPIC